MAGHPRQSWDSQVRQRAGLMETWAKRGRWLDTQDRGRRHGSDKWGKRFICTRSVPHRKLIIRGNVKCRVSCSAPLPNFLLAPNLKSKQFPKSKKGIGNC